MTSTFRRFAAALLATFAIALPASAGTTYSTDYTDLWFNPAESGWGVNLIQQYETIFATLFVYGADNSARWYVASDLRGSGQNNFTGTLYQTTGPAFTAPWTGGAVVTPVGSMTFTFASANTGTLTYVVNGASVTKQIQRQTFRTNTLSGPYLGGLTAVASACNNPSDNGFTLSTGVMSVTQNGNSISIRVEFKNAGGTPGVCGWSGTYTAAGRLGTITGTSSCTVGSATTSGNFTMSEVDVGKNGFSAVYSGRDSFCTNTGYFGGIRDVL